MFSFCWVTFSYFTLVNCICFPQERCNESDCSSQLQPFQNESCLIYDTKVCLQSMSNFTKASEIKLESEKDAKFTGFIFPYIAEVYYPPAFLNFSAINVSFIIHDKGLDALAIKIKGQLRTICRIFDFHSSQSFVSLPVHLFYDCLYFPRNSQFINVEVDMISLPSNEHLSYYVYIPESILMRTPCDWQPVIMVFRGKLADGIVKLKLSTAPQQFNISVYTVELVEKYSNKTMSLTLVSNLKAGILITEFLSVPYGYYAVIVKPSTGSCFGTETVSFTVGKPKSALDIITVVCICIIVVFVICSLAVYKFCILPIKLSSKRRNSSTSMEDNDNPKNLLTRLSNEDNDHSENAFLLDVNFSEIDEEIVKFEEKFRPLFK